MTNNRPQRACLWLRVSTDSKGQDPELQRADLEGVRRQRVWQIVKVYEVEESAFGKKPREQFQAMLEDAHRGKFDILVMWSLDRFSREGE
jgi:DNA invertase Pin-like site-specific DNA recombinase